MEPSAVNEPKVEKPRQVTLAVTLILGAVFFDLLFNLYGIISAFQSDPTGFSFESRELFGFAIGLLYPSILAFNINKRQNWARWLYLIEFAFTLLSVFALLISLPAYALYAAFTTVIALAQLIAVILLFQKSSRTWFNSNQNAKNGGNALNAPSPFRRKK
jgi:hypothetical protein